MPLTAEEDHVVHERGICRIWFEGGKVMSMYRYLVVREYQRQDRSPGYGCLLLGILLLLTLVASESRGEVGDVLTSFTPDPVIENRYCAIGLAFDGSNLYMNRCSDPNIYTISSTDGSRISDFLPPIPEWPAAMAFDAKRNGLWFGTQMGLGGLDLRDCGNIGMPIYFWDFDDNSVTLMFTIPADLVNPANGQRFFRFCLLDGLTYNENDPNSDLDDEIWFSETANRNIGVMRPDGTFVDGTDPTTTVDGDLANGSGLSIGVDKLYMATDCVGSGCSDIFVADRLTDPLMLTLLGTFVSQNLTDVDMACDPITFAPTEVMWVRTNPRGIVASDLITAYEIEPGGCGQAAPPLGACCVSAMVSCTNDVSQTTCQAMQGSWTQGATCPEVSGCVANEVILLDRTGSMKTIRCATGNSRCFDALQAAKMDVSRFFTAHSAGSSLAVWTFANGGPIDLTGGFVTDAATAITMLNSLDGVACGGLTPLAESICDAVDALAAAFPSAPQAARILAVSSDGAENFSDMNCAGPDSAAGMACGEFDPGSWQQQVCDKIVGNGVAQIRFWGTFGGCGTTRTLGLDSETGVLRSVGISDTIFFSALANATGGTFTFFEDNLPPPSGPPAFGVPGACCLPDATCQEPITQAECAALGGTHQGDASICADATGACCLPDDTCQDAMTQTACTGQGGTFQGTCTTCANDVLGACCLPDATCQDGLTAAQCTAQNGTHQGGCSVCTGAPGECKVNVPTVSQWGLVLMTLLVVIAGTIILRGRGMAHTVREGMIQ